MWVDLFTYMFAQQNTQVLLRSVESSSYDVGDYIPLDDPDELIVLRETSYPIGEYRPPNDIDQGIGGVLSIEYDRAGDGYLYNAEAVFAFISANNAFNLVGRRIRVRAIPDGPTPGVAPIEGIGSSGFVFVNQSGTGHELFATIVNHSLEGTGGTATINQPLPWHEHEVTIEDITPESVNQEFVGIGSIGTAPDVDPPLFARTAYEWQIWVDDTRPPWWMCPVPTPVEPCPIRTTDFVPFDQYDVDFKFPQSSSRVPAKNPRPTDCITCRPNIIDPVIPEPEPPEVTCISITIYDGNSSNAQIRLEDMTDLPSWFDENSNFTVLLEYTGGDATCEYQPNLPNFDKISGDDIFAPLNGTGTLTQGANEICIIWNILEPA